MTSRHYSPRSITIIASEVSWLLVTLALAIALDLTLQQSGAKASQIVKQVTFAALLYLSAFYYSDLYNFSELRIRRELITATVRGFSTLAVLFAVILLFTHWAAFRSVTILVHLVATTVFILVLRMHIDGVLIRHGVLTQIAIVGAGAEATGLAAEIQKRPECGHELICFVSGNAETGGPVSPSRNLGQSAVPVIAAASLVDYAQQHRIKRLLVATADLGDALPVDELLRCKAAGIEVEDGHTFYERLLGRILITNLRPEWLIFSGGFVRPVRVQAMKRAGDFIIATCLLVVTAPLCVLVAAAIKLQDRGPVLFSQTRVGREGRLFKVYKFRSMRVDAEQATGPCWAEENDSRITWVGRWIRKLRIDEIPQAWNVLRGDMSFVGPRPERPEFMAELRSAIPYYDHRHAVRPGITGWAQVNFPYAATIDHAREKLEYDLYYLKNFGLVMDMLILARTMKILLFGWGSR